MAVPTFLSTAFWRDTGYKFKSKAFVPKPTAHALDTSASGSDMKRVLGAFDLTFLGIGGIIGAGVFVLTGVAAKQEAGPSVVLSYIIASFVAILSAFCYTEFAVDTPIAGGAFVYVHTIFGEFLGWIAATNLVLEYTLGAAAVARSFTSYLGALINGDADLFRIPTGSPYFLADVPALLCVLSICALLGFGTQGGARFNTVVTMLNLVVIGFVLATGLPHFKRSNFVPFFPKGLRGTFAGASKVFFSFIGFDTVSTAAEETKNPAFDLPMGIVASLCVCAALYAAMCVTICGMVYWEDIDIHAPFAAAYEHINMGWAGKVVALGALAGILTSLLVNLFGQIRLILCLGRDRLVPAPCGTVHEHTGTPVNATIITATTAGLFALIVDLEALADLVSIGTLTVFLMVALAALWRRYVPHGQRPAWTVPAKLAVIVLAALGLSACYTAAGPAAVTLVFGGVWLAGTASLWWEPVVWVAPKFRIPLNPLVPCLAVLANLFLISSLGSAAYIRFVIWLVLSVAVYVLFGVHHSTGGSPLMEAGIMAGSDDGAAAADDQKHEAYSTSHSMSPTHDHRAVSPRRHEGSGHGKEGRGPRSLQPSPLGTQAGDIELAEA